MFTLSTSDCTVLRSPFSAALIKSTDSLILAINNDPSNKQSRREWWECCYIDVLLFCWHGMWQQKTIQKLIWFVERSRQQSFQPFCWWSRMQSKQLISIQSNEIKSLFLFNSNGRLTLVWISFMNSSIYVYFLPLQNSSKHFGTTTKFWNGFHQWNQAKLGLHVWSWPLFFYDLFTLIHV